MDDDTIKKNGQRRIGKDIHTYKKSTYETTKDKEKGFLAGQPIQVETSIDDDKSKK
jgi:hypothetical protein